MKEEAEIWSSSSTGLLAPLGHRRARGYTPTPLRGVQTGTHNRSDGHCTGSKGQRNHPLPTSIKHLSFIELDCMRP